MFGGYVGVPKLVSVEWVKLEIGVAIPVKMQMLSFFSLE